MPPQNDLDRGARRAKLVRRARAYLLTALGLSALFVALGGFLHTKAGRPILARLFPGTCPMNFATADAVDRARRIGVAADRGTTAAPARPAFEFRLDGSTKPEVLAWAKQHRVACSDEHAWLVKCLDVDPVALGRPSAEGRIEELALGFRPDGRLVNVSTLRRHLTPVEANSITDQIAGALARQLGQPRSAVEGTVTDESLSSKRLSFRYADYSADVVAMNLPQSGVAVREHYLSAAD